MAMDDHRLVHGLIAVTSAALAWPLYWLKARALGNQIERYRHAFDLAPAPMWLKAPDGLIVAVNRQFEAHFGLSMADYAGTTLQQQQALWAGSEIGSFDDTDELARGSDEIVLTHAQLRAPRPERSQLQDSNRHYEYFISKRRFPIRHAWGTSYGTIGSAVSIESVMQYAEKARARHEEIVDRNPILHAIAELSKQVNGQVGELKDRLDTITSDVRRVDADLELLFEGREDLRRTLIAKRDLEQFEGFERP